MTDDADFKRLVRERMTKTGESYTTARRQLRPDDHDADREPQQPSAPAATSFGLVNDPEERAAFIELMDRSLQSGGVEMVGEHLHVWMGNPPSWEAHIPLTAVRRIERVPDGRAKRPGAFRNDETAAVTSMNGGTSVFTRGAHGNGRGRWLVNSSNRNLVRLWLQDGVRADLRISQVMPDQKSPSRNPIIRLLMRDRTVKVKELTVSVADPDGFIAAVRSRI